jgi:hypothetical protein
MGGFSQGSRPSFLPEIADFSHLQWLSFDSNAYFTKVLFNNWNTVAWHM